MHRYYPPAFYWSWEGADRTLSWEEILVRRGDQLRQKARWLADMKPGRLLDIGAQKGEFLWEMRRLGWQVQGVELDASIPNPAVLPIRYGDFLSMDFAPSSFDCITFWAVLEHVYHPARFLERAASLLRPGGRLVALVTNLNSIQARFHRADDFPRHLTVFTSRSVQYLCETNGLRVTRLHTGQEIFGGALNGGLVYFAKRLAGYSEDEAFREWKQSSDPDLFWVKWRGRPSRVMRGISRVDRALTLPLEWLLDRLGFGFILTFAAIKDDRLWKSE